MNSIEQNEKNLETIENNQVTVKKEKAASGENRKKPAFAVMGNSALKTTIAVGLAAAIIGGVIGYSVKPVAKTQDLVVTEDVSAVIAENNGTAAAGAAAAETPGKTYTQITDIMDNARHVVEERYYAADGSIVACEDGYAIMRKEYDDNGNVVSTAYFDTADQPFLVEKLGYASISESGEQKLRRCQYTYDENKNIASEEFFDAEGTPILSADGYHKGVYTWDDAKHKLTERYYGIDGTSS